MTLPLPPGAVSPATAAAETPSNPAADDAAEAEATAKNAIKQFGPSEDANGEPIPVPRAHNVDATAVLVDLHAAFVSVLAKNNITDVDDYLEKAEAIDKTTFPGNKEGRTSYGTIQVMSKIRKLFEVWTRKRGDGAASTKSKLVEKDNKIAALEQQLAELRAKLGL